MEKMLDKLVNMGIDPKVAEGLNKAILMNGMLYFDTVKELSQDDLLNVKLVAPADKKFYLVNNNLLFQLEPREVVINPYEEMMNIWEEFIEDEGISSYNLPFNVFYFYYSEYAKWLENEEITEEDTSFSEYMEEFHSISDFSGLSLPTGVIIDVSNIEKTTIYENRLIMKVNETLAENEKKVQELSDLLETIPGKIKNLNEVSAALKSLIS